MDLHYEQRPDPVTMGMRDDLLVTRFRIVTIEVRVGVRESDALALRYPPDEPSRGAEGW
ncbi:MAG: hypothetical protein ACXVH1_36060 [Solirubrobacteraceae bacterium]